MSTIAEKMTYLNETKDLIKEAIAAKGVTIDDGATFRSYAGLIGKIQAGSGSSTGAELNIAYGVTAPEDTGMLWVKTNKPDNVVIDPDIGGGENVLESGIATLPMAANTIAAEAVGSKIYLFGGSISSNSKLNTVNVFDTETETLTTLSTALPTGLYGIASAAVGTKIYLFGGNNGNSSLKTIRVFDTETETLTTLSTTLPIVKANSPAAAVGTKIYLFGGDTTERVYVFDTETETITKLSTTLPRNIANCPAVAVGNKIYLFGGFYSETFNAISVFDTETETFNTPSTTLPTATHAIAGAAIGAKIYLFGGWGGSDLNTINVFDTNTESITTLGTTLPIGASSIASAAVGTKVYLFGGGTSSGALNTINKFIVKFPLQTNTLHIQSTTAENIFTMIDTGNIAMQIGVKEAYIGNSEGYAEKVEAALYKDGAWTNI